MTDNLTTTTPDSQEERSASQWIDDLHAMTGAEQIVSTVEVALAEGTDARPVEFLRIGVFTDANGKKVEINQAKLDALVATFETGEAGQDVPIDILHRREEAAGWVRSVYQQDGKLFAVPEWNNLGKQLVGDKMYRYLSATIDLARNVLRSISLVNFPAVKGLRPVELAETDIVSDPAPPSQVIQEPGQNTATTAPAQEILTMAEEQVVQSAPPPAAPPTPPAMPASVALNEADLAGIRANMEREMRQAIMAEYAQLQASQEKMLAELMTQMREERETTEFAQAVTTDANRALPFTPDEMKSLISSLPMQYRGPIKDAFKRIVDTGLVDFSERGTARGSAAPQALPADTAMALRSFIRGGGTVETFFEANAELGSAKSYDLAEYNSTGG
jgi:hypothetical protein